MSPKRYIPLGYTSWVYLLGDMHTSYVTSQGVLPKRYTCTQEVWTSRNAVQEVCPRGIPKTYIPLGLHAYLLGIPLALHVYLLGNIPLGHTSWVAPYLLGCRWFYRWPDGSQEHDMRRRIGMAMARCGKLCHSFLIFSFFVCLHFFCYSFVDFCGNVLCVVCVCVCVCVCFARSSRVHSRCARARLCCLSSIIFLFFF